VRAAHPLQGLAQSCAGCVRAEYVADRLLVALGCEKLYNTRNPFDWMEQISLQVACLLCWELLLPADSHTGIMLGFMVW
jgi:hypothetical protein